MELSRRRLAVLTVLLTLPLTFVLAFTWFEHEMSSVHSVDRLAFIKKRVRKQFPEAPQISTSELAKRLDAGEDIVLLDVRRREEYEVSHLEGARWVDPDSERPPLLEIAKDGRAVVAYCSVGWRSSKLVEKLREQGIPAENLEGSIFQWVGEGRPVVRDGEPTQLVHPYGRAWAWLLDPEHRAPLSDR